MLAAFSGFLSVLFALVLCLRRPWGIAASGPLRRRVECLLQDAAALTPGVRILHGSQPGRAYLLDECVVLQGVAVMAIGLLSPLAQEPQAATQGRPRFRMAGSANGPLTLSTNSPTEIIAEHERRQFLAALAAGVLGLYGSGDAPLAAALFLMRRYTCDRFHTFEHLSHPRRLAAPLANPHVCFSFYGKSHVCLYEPWRSLSDAFSRRPI